MSSGLRALLSLAWPIVIARSAQAVIGFCDALMTAPLGEASVAAVTTGSLNTFNASIFPMGVVFIAQSFASQLSSKGDPAAARRYGWYALLVAAAAGAVSLALIPLIGPMVGWLSYEEAVRGAMTDYLEIRALSIGFVVGVEAVGNWYGGMGNTRVHMVAGMVTMVVNVALNWVLIEGHLGAPAMGVRGAAWASVLAALVGFSVAIVPFVRGWFVPRVERLGRLSGAELMRMLRFGMPHGMNWFLEFAAFTVFINVIVARLGTTPVAAIMIVFNINSVSFMPAFGIASSGAILTGNAIGAGNQDDVPKTVWLTLRVAAVWQGLVGLVYLLFPKPLMQLFADAAQTGELLAVGATLLAISAAWQLFDAASMTVSESLRAAGDTTWCMWARIVVAWVLFIPAAYLTVWRLDGGHVAAMLCMVGYLGSLAVVFGLRFRTGKWREIDLTGDEDLLAA